MEISKCKLRQASGLSHRFALRPSPPTNLGSFSDFVTSTFIPWLFNETVRLVPYSPSQSAHHWLLQLILSTSFQTFSKSSKHILHPLMLLPLWPLFFGIGVQQSPLTCLHLALFLYCVLFSHCTQNELFTKANQILLLFCLKSFTGCFPIACGKICKFLPSVPTNRSLPGQLSWPDFVAGTLAFFQFSSVCKLFVAPGHLLPLPGLLWASSSLPFVTLPKC